MKLTSDDKAVLSALADRAAAMIDQTVAWSNLNSGSRHLAGLQRQADALFPVLQSLPGVAERVGLLDSQEVTATGEVKAMAHADGLRLTVRPDAPVQIALTGHYDTVYPADSPFQTVARRTDGALHGPGVADMKGGLSVMLAALAAFEAHPAAAGLGYQVLISPDEEIGSVASAPLLAALGERAQLGLTYEPALTSGALAAGRKGSGNFHLVVRGRAAHAGRDFAAGRNAVTAAARLATALDGINGAFPGLTLNVARIDGGAPLNQVPDLAIVRFNVRLPDAYARAFVETEISRLVREAEVDGISLSLHGGVTRPPKPFSPEQQALFSGVRQVGALIGQDIVWAESGGVCEGNNLFAAGVPNVDSLGVRGGDIHSEAEHAFPESFVERAQLSALLLIKIAEGGIDAPGLKAARLAAMREEGG